MASKTICSLAEPLRNLSRRGNLIANDSPVVCNCIQGKRHPDARTLAWFICSEEGQYALNSRSLRWSGPFRTFRCTVILLFALAFAAGCRHPRKSTSAPNTADYADNIQSVVDKSQLGILRWPNYSDYQQAVKTFYDDRNYELAWLRDLKPTPQTTAFIAAFESADQKGLTPEDYDAGRWAPRLLEIGRIDREHDTSSAA